MAGPGLAAFVGAAFSLWIGKRIEAGAGRTAIAIAFAVAAAVLMFRAVAVGSPDLAGAAAAFALLWRRYGAATSALST